VSKLWSFHHFQVQFNCLHTHLYALLVKHCHLNSAHSKQQHGNTSDTRSPWCKRCAIQGLNNNQKADVQMCVSETYLHTQTNEHRTSVCVCVCVCYATVTLYTVKFIFGRKINKIEVSFSATNREQKHKRF